MKKKFYSFLITLVFIMSVNSQGTAKTLTLTKTVLKDKIMGGWAGQTIGVTFGGPYEFKFNGTLIGDYQSLNWYDGYLKKVMNENPGLYDDLYMDLTFVDVFEKFGLDAPADSFANAFANAGYVLWHANQAGRYNILNGIKAPLSGHWKHNPHADCIDYQIESDFAGLMCPGMPNAASAISDKVGHTMNFGDGWYGGVYVGAMYSLAFVSSDVNYIVTEALKTIPKQAEFYQCINDVIGWHKKYPTDWKKTWFEVQRKWTDEVGCPDGVFAPFNIDAKVNAAYVVIGLLYGSGDYTKTLEITTRCGQDADCNPSSAGGILGTVLGYSKIPAYWKLGLKEAESIDFKYTTMSLDDVYKIGLEHALKVIERNGGKINGENVTVKLQQPVAVRFEKSFPNLYPKEKQAPKWSANKEEFSFDFEGTGFVIRGETAKWSGESNLVINAELYVDGQKAEMIKLPSNYTTRRYDLAWKYDLPKGKHQVRFRLVDAPKENNIQGVQVIAYSDKPVDGLNANNRETF